MNIYKLLLLNIFLATSACSPSQPLEDLKKVVVSPIPPPDGVGVHFCTDVAQRSVSSVKYLVILDHSGSNAINNKMNPDGTPDRDASGNLQVGLKFATDLHGDFRYGDVKTPGSLLSFVSTLANSKNLSGASVAQNSYFSLINFSDNAKSIPSSGNFVGPTEFLPILIDDKNGGNPNDSGRTNYSGALIRAQAVITADIQNSKNCAAAAPGSTYPLNNCIGTPGVLMSSIYVIIFESDGAPLVGTGIPRTLPSGSPEPDPGLQPSGGLLNNVSSIINLKLLNQLYVESINLYTVYYYAADNKDGTGETLLQNMAQTGRGVAYSAQSGIPIDFNQFAPPSKLLKETLADVFVTNSNIAFWSGNSIPSVPLGLPLLDSDMDGLPDLVENYLGSDPLSIDSDGNGVSDFVEYYLNNGKPCKALDPSGNCTSGGANSYISGACFGVTLSSVGSAIQFKHTTPDGLNDCEKILLNNLGGFNSPDSNGDLISDWLEFKSGLAFVTGAAAASTLNDADGYNLYNKVKLSLPVNYPYGQILHPQPSTYQLVQTSTSTSQDCYQLTVHHLPVIGLNNHIRVEVLLKNSQGNLVYKIGMKQFSGTSLVLNFNDWNDPTEQAQSTWKMWP